VITISTQDFDQLKQNAVFGKLMENKKNNSFKTEQDAIDFVEKNMSSEQIKKFKDTINDQDKVAALLSSEKAKALLKFIMESEKNE